MKEGAAALKWGVERRLEFIEFRLFWEGGVNRSDIIEMFDVSVPQASKDLTLYQERAPQNAIYDKSAKRYVASPQFSPIFLKPDPDSYLSRLRSLAEGLTDPGDSWIANPPQTDIALTPRREVDPIVLRAIISAIRDKRSIEIYYQSMNRERAEPMWRRMTPHAFGYDGLRWHARAYCHVDKKFKDFLLTRILDLREMGNPGPGRDQDTLWQETFDVEIGPHPHLTPSQRAVVAKDYGMTNERAVLTTRYAMLFYVLRRLGLLGDATQQDPRTQHIVSLNAAETARALKRAEFELDDPAPSATLSGSA
ncbi:MULTISPECIES: YafY family protein [unclassified Bradyrhizobium]|uniref:helix-turn-helix transcriptional regulator n=1 Tax=unclassified Bradyrhizobium TaxID=2631580 RepID=UPI001CD5C5B5|nr:MULTISPECIES: WYL domain-containing protein [unclassified Bradyrhizobium]MCA1398432.1 WYL domain-containing protein [Bradyrhizobium sp. BRP56]UWU92695.1 WYL domain-containing protein [Bradyrhizobium sp. CB1015]